jgi:hypothetical protein
MRLTAISQDIDPDGVALRIKWERLVLGGSVFIPCINSEECEKQIKKITNKLGFRIRIKRRIENKKCGIRIWRN